MVAWYRLSLAFNWHKVLQQTITHRCTRTVSFLGADWRVLEEYGIFPFSRRLHAEQRLSVPNRHPVTTLIEELQFMAQSQERVFGSLHMLSLVLGDTNYRSSRLSQMWQARSVA